MFLLLLTLLIITIALYSMRYYYHLIRGLFLMWKIPGPPSYPIIGCAHLFINKTTAGVCMWVFKSSSCDLFKIVYFAFLSAFIPLSIGQID